MTPAGGAGSGADVQTLFRKAAEHDDAQAMREGFEALMGLDGGGLSAEREFELRRPDFVMEMPQSRERVRGRAAMRSLQERFPGRGPDLSLVRVSGAGRFWTVEGRAVYAEGEDPWLVVLLVELDEDGLLSRETRYYTQRSEAPEWRRDLVEPMD